VALPNISSGFLGMFSGVSTLSIKYIQCCYLLASDNTNKLYKFTKLQTLSINFVDDVSVTAAAFFGTTVRQVSLRRTVSNHRYEDVRRTRRLVVTSSGQSFYYNACLLGGPVMWFCFGLYILSSSCLCFMLLKVKTVKGSL